MTFRATKNDAEAWVAGLKLSDTAGLHQYHLLECQDDSSRIVGLPDAAYFKRLVLSKRDDGINFISVREDDDSYTPLPQLQAAFEMAFKLKQPMADSRDVDGNSWRDRPKLF